MSYSKFKKACIRKNPDFMAIQDDAAIRNEVPKGGMEINEVNLVLDVEFQDEESFLGKSRTSATPNDQPSVRVWGTIRSTGDEAIFVTSNGGRGQLWFAGEDEFEFCVANVSEDSATAYCANLAKE